MSNSEYWQQRFELLEEAQNNQRTEYLDLLKGEYEKSLSRIEKDITNWYTRIADNNEISFDNAKKLLDKKELKEFKWTVEEYIEKGRENAINQKWLKELENTSAKVHINELESIKIQIQNELENLYKKQNKDVENLLKKQYKESYYKSAYEIQNGLEQYCNIQKIDTNKIDKIISKPWTTDNQTFSDRIWKHKEELLNTLQKDLTQATIRGDDLNKITKKIEKDFEVSRGKAGRLVMTESAFFSSAGQKECFNSLNVKQYEIVSTLDSHTSEICQKLDGKVFDMKDYEVGITAPPFHCNCRTTTAPYFDDEFTDGEQRAYRDEDGKTKYVDSKMQYKEWYEKYANNEKNTSTNSNSDDIMNIPKFYKKIIKNTEQLYTKNEIEEIAKNTLEIANKYTINNSKWSGNIIESNRFITAKLWSCDIEVENYTSPHAILHEQLHAHSISYFDKETYKKYKKIEEATVELYAKEISRKEKILNVVSDYDNWVNNLKIINNKVKIASNDFEFAQILFNKPVTERLDFLEGKIQEYLIGKTIDEAIELNNLMEVLYVK